jgi:peptide/nickel transport system ATP-binding protein
VMQEQVTYGIAGCRFAPRCPRVLPKCWTERPEMELAGTSQFVACHNWRG